MSVAAALPVQFPTLNKKAIRTLQVNLGPICNQSCIHCHMNAGPDRIEKMPRWILEDILWFLHNNPIETLDITGGAPELHLLFRYFLTQARPLVSRLIVRCNLTVLHEAGMEDLPEVYRDAGVELMCSLPCYLEENVNRQRGSGVYEKSIRALTLLNAVGYGKEETDLLLNIIHNPGGASLPGEQTVLEEDYKRELFSRFGITFNQLFCMTNMPINRFEEYLKEKQSYEDYMSLLQKNINLSTFSRLMCLNQLSVRWDGTLYDCDFNQMLDYKLTGKGTVQIGNATIKDLEGIPVAIGQHCLGCVAGSGSSCGGSLI
jgi:radical SAM/Cys-rich protein